MSLTNQRGFTLLELLIAISIFAIISLASFSIFDTVIKSEEKSTGRISQMNEIQRAFMLMERDFIQIAKRSLRLEGEEPLEGFIHTDSDDYDSSSQSLGFVRTGWTNPALLLPRSDMQSVAYRLNDDKLLERIHYNFVDASLNELPKIRPLISNVNNISFEFHDGKAWSKSFDGNDLPLAISIELDTSNFGVITRKFLVPGAIQTTSAVTP
jgi:general secretion pathway protein J